MKRLFRKLGLETRLSQNYIRGEIDPDEILIDAKNLPDYDLDRLEGKFEKPVTKRAIILVGVVFTLTLLVFAGKAWALQIHQGTLYAQKSENNRLHEATIIAERGIVTDRKGELLAWNIPNLSGDFPLRKYTEDPGFGILLGYISYPLKDSSGLYYQPYYVGKDGIESAFNTELAGKNGTQITETNALGDIESQSLLEPPQNGKTVQLSIDTSVQRALFGYIKDLAEKVEFKGGSGVIMDIKTGELLAMTSYPEYNPQVLTDGVDKETIASYAQAQNKPYLDRPISGVYTPGSIIKPYIALGALSENIIDPEKQILSTGSISVPNPYDKTKKTVFNDWKVHGLVDMRRAIAVSSNVYFFEIGGGFEDQKGLGISNIEKYLRFFGFGSQTGINVGEEEVGTIPNPAWKADHFDGEEWRVGDTYNTAIGQYGMQVTSVQVVRAMASIANNGTLLKPTIIMNQGNNKGEKIPIKEEYLQIIREGMRAGVTDGGTAQALNIPEVTVAAKTGTAELGSEKRSVNSWVTGFFPYENPRYAFIVQMESGPRANLTGATFVMRSLFEWMAQNTPEYFRSE